MARVTSVECPRCGAPLPLANGATALICLYCNASVRVEHAASDDPRPPTLSIHAVKPDVVQRVKQLVLDGKRADAVALYAQEVKLDRNAAERTVDELLTPLTLAMVRRAPFSAFGFFNTLLTVAALAVSFVWSALRVADGAGYVVLAATTALLLAAFLWRIVIPKLISHGVRAWGTEGRAAILNRAILKPGIRKGFTAIRVVMRVEPVRGGASFVDDESLLVRDESLAKLVPGCVIRVRFDDGKDRRVFPISL